MEAIRQTKMELEGQHTTCENDLQKQADDIVKMRELIKDSELRTKDKKQEEVDLKNQME